MKIELNLSERDEDRLRLKAAAGGMSISELLENFANDLIHGEQTNGSDERMYARAWYDRCGFTYFENSFLSCLAQDMIVDRYVEIYQTWKETGDAALAAEVQEAYHAYGLTGNWQQEMAEAIRIWKS
jgi:hypothetical protein